MAAAFKAEVEHYRPLAHTAGDAASLAALRLDCAGVFLYALGDPVEPDAFVDDFMAALAFAPVHGAVEAVARLRSAGLLLAVVANWDCALPEHLAAVGLLDRFDTVVTRHGRALQAGPRHFSAGAPRAGRRARPRPACRRRAIDEQGARAAGLAFLPAPLLTAFEGWR